MSTRPPWEDFRAGGFDEGRFRSWYQGHAKRQDLDPDPDAPEHFYDYRAAFTAGATPDASGHWPSQFKREGHPRLVIDGIDTRTGQPAEDGPWSDYRGGTSKPALLGGAGATMGPAADDGQGLARVWQEAGRKLKEAIMGHPDRAEARAAGIGLQPTPAELGEAALAGGAAMLGGSAMGGIAAAPVKAGMAMAGGYAGEKAGSGLGELAESAGAPSGTATVAGGIGALAGAASPARALRSLAGGRAGQVLEAVSPRAGAAVRQALGGAEAAAPAAPLLSEGPRTLHVPAGMARQAGQGRVVQIPAGPSAAQAGAEEVQAKVMSLREKGLSGAQITSALRQLYGIPPSQGQKMVDMVLESMKSGARVR